MENTILNLKSQFESELQSSPMLGHSLAEQALTSAKGDTMSMTDVEKLKLEQQKNDIYADMMLLGDDFTALEQTILAKIADLVFVFHQDQFRKGNPTTHYTKHLLEVAQRVKKNFVEVSEEFTGSNGSKISGKAIATFAALLHDSKEDIAVTYPVFKSDMYKGFAVVEGYLRKTLSQYFDLKSLNRLLEVVDNLTIKNSSDTADTEYMNAIAADPIAIQIKRADIDHNMLTSHEVTALNGVLVAATGYYQLMKESEYRVNYLQGVCRCVVSAQKQIQQIDLNRSPSTSDERKLDRLLQVEGELTGQMLLNFYQELETLLDCEVELIPTDYEKSEIILAIDTVRQLAGKISAYESPSNYFPVKERQISGLNVRELGPIRAWTATLTSHCDLNTLKDAIKNAAITNDQRISGFITENANGSFSYTLSRWPRRVEEAVPACIDFEKSVLEIQKHLLNKGIRVSLEIQPDNKDEMYRSLLGLEEGYYEGRKKNLFARVDLNTGEEFLKAFVETIGDPLDFGIDKNAFADIETAKATLENLSLSKTHSLAEVQSKLDSKDIAITPANIFAVSAGNSYFYEEPAVLLTSANNSEFLDKLVNLANDFHQARVSVEIFGEYSKAWNLEFIENSSNAAAK